MGGYTAFRSIARWYIYPRKGEGCLVKVDVCECFEIQARKRGLSRYIFDSDRDHTTTIVILETRDECFKFAAACYDQIKAGLWTTRSYSYADPNRITGMAAREPEKGKPKGNQLALF